MSDKSDVKSKSIILTSTGIIFTGNSTDDSKETSEFKKRFELEQKKRRKLRFRLLRLIKRIDLLEVIRASLIILFSAILGTIVSLGIVGGLVALGVLSI